MLSDSLYNTLHMLQLTILLSRCSIIFFAALVQVDEESSKTLSVRIRTKHGVSFGEVIRIVGAGSALGDWNPNEAPGGFKNQSCNRKGAAFNALAHDLAIVMNWRSNTVL